MRKTILCIVSLLTVTFTLFAESLTRNTVKKDIGKRNLTILAQNSDYTLAKDRNGTFYFYSENWLTTDVYIYKEREEVSRSFVMDKLNSAESSSKVMTGEYTVYRIDMGFFLQTYYVVLTPRNKFYRVDEKINTIHADGNALADELAALDDTPTPSTLSEGSVLRCNDNLRLRSQSSTSSSVVTSMKKGTRVRIVEIGRSDTSEGVRSNWVMVEVLEGGVDKNGVPIQGGTRGWCFGGFLE